MRDELEQRLERLRQESPGAPDYLAERILSNLPVRNPLTALTEWLTRSLWRPALAFAMPLAFGFLIGFIQPMNEAMPETELFADAATEFEFDEL
jgi:hypothetical protein